MPPLLTTVLALWMWSTSTTQYRSRILLERPPVRRPRPLNRCRFRRPFSRRPPFSGTTSDLYFIKSEERKYFYTYVTHNTNSPNVNILPCCQTYIPAGLKSTNCWPLLSLSLWKEGVMGLALADDGRLPASLSSPPLIPQAPTTTPATRDQNQTGTSKYGHRFRLRGSLSTSTLHLVCTVRVANRDYTGWSKGI